MKAEEFEVGPLKVTIGYDEASGCNPRTSWDNLGTMTCWHPDYVLGDEQFHAPTGRGAVETKLPGDPYFEALEDVAEYLEKKRKAICIMPLILYDHSGITIKVGKVGDIPGDAAGWDTTPVGFIWTSLERIKELGAPNEAIEKQLQGEVEIYDRYLRGDVFYYTIEDEDGDCLASCGGILDELDEIKEQATEEARAFAVDATFVDAAPVEEAIQNERD
jgi:hypothetical protein